jgi:energy-coupling factor transporter ATP-binding protein EcfA2
VVLVGPPGSGKSTVASTLARLLGVTARDTDADVERTARKPIREIFVDDGEPAFRDLERAAVTAALRDLVRRARVGVGGPSRSCRCRVEEPSMRPASCTASNRNYPQWLRRTLLCGCKGWCVRRAERCRGPCSGA